MSVKGLVAAITRALLKVRSRARKHPVNVDFLGLELKIAKESVLRSHWGLIVAGAKAHPPKDLR